MTLAAVYRTRDPKTVAQYRANVASAGQWKQRLAEFRAEHNIPATCQLWANRQFDGATYPIGFSWDGKEPAPPGWRIPMGYGHPVIPVTIQPNRRVKAGKEIGRQLDQLSHPGRKARLGMPLDATDYESMIRYWFGLGFDELTEALWVGWAIDPTIDKRFVQDLDPVWERVKLSEYYAMAETGFDPFATKEKADA